MSYMQPENPLFNREQFEQHVGDVERKKTVLQQIDIILAACNGTYNENLIPGVEVPIHKFQTQGFEEIFSSISSTSFSYSDIYLSPAYEDFDISGMKGESRIGLFVPQGEKINSYRRTYDVLRIFNLAKHDKSILPDERGIYVARNRQNNHLVMLEVEANPEYEKGDDRAWFIPRKLDAVKESLVADELQKAADKFEEWLSSIPDQYR